MSRHLNRVSLAASTLVLAFAASGVAGTPPRVDSYRVRERVAYANFDFPADFSGCIQTGVSVTLSESASRFDSGKQEPTTWAAVSIYRYDRCHGYQTLLSAYGSRSLQPGELDFQGNLASAGLHATFDLLDYVTNTTYTAKVELTWTATGATTHVQERYSVFGPGFRYTASLQGSNRPAQTAGSVLFDSVEVLDGTSNYGVIYNLRNGYISVSRE